MTVIPLRQAETQLADLIARAQTGEEIIIERDNAPLAKLVAVEAKPVTDLRRAGALADVLRNIPSHTFFDPLPHEELDAWEGKYSLLADDDK